METNSLVMPVWPHVDSFKQLQSTLGSHSVLQQELFCYADSTSGLGFFFCEHG